MAIQEAEVLQGRYRVVRSIKSGGMGAVYEAVDMSLADSPCAVKEVLPSALHGPDADYILKSFEKEVRALASLDHPNIPRVRDFFERDGSRFIVMDLVRGQTLDDELREHLRLTGEAMDPLLAAQDMLSVLETLHYLHTLQPALIHRDIKPANIIRDQQGRLKLVDFGVARTLVSQQVQTQVGTPGYCAPEQMSGRAEARSDIYSVGATLYQLCSGKTPAPFSFGALELNLPEHPGLATIVARATAIKPDQRYANCAEMGQALRAYLKGESVTQAVPAPPSRPVQAKPAVAEPSQDRILYAAIGVLMLVLGGFLLWVVRQNHNHQPLPVRLSSPVVAATPSSLSTKSPPATPPPKSVPQVVPRVAKATPPPKPSPQAVIPVRSRRQPLLPRLQGDQSYPTRALRPRPPEEAPSTAPEVARTEPERPNAQPDTSPDSKDLAGFRPTGETTTNGLPVYTCQVEGCKVDIRPYAFPHLSNDQILAKNLRERPLLRNMKRFERSNGICIVSPDRDCNRGWHIEDGMMYGIEVHPHAVDFAPIYEAIDRFTTAYAAHLGTRAR
jgi:serine/threonine protein kinase